MQVLQRFSSFQKFHFSVGAVLRVTLLMCLHLLAKAAVQTAYGIEMDHHVLATDRTL